MTPKITSQRKNYSASGVLLYILSVMLMTSCSAGEKGTEIVPVDLSTTSPVGWDIELQSEHISIKHLPNESIVNHLALVRLQIINLPPSEEGNSYTLIGGGLNNTGLHGPNATGFEGKGYYFAKPRKTEGDNPPRDVGYKDDYTRTVRNGALAFEIFYEPTNLNEWGDQYFPGTELALTLTRAGTVDRVLHSSDNEQHWAIAGVGEGNAADITLDMRMAEYTWHMDL
ncbi:MAG: hypothetical protein WD491_01855 [Balneolales bacterium]